MWAFSSPWVLSKQTFNILLLSWSIFIISFISTIPQQHPAASSSPDGKVARWLCTFCTALTSLGFTLMETQMIHPQYKCFSYHGLSFPAQREGQSQALGCWAAPSSRRWAFLAKLNQCPMLLLHHYPTNTSFFFPHCIFLAFPNVFFLALHFSAWWAANHY